MSSLRNRLTIQIDLSGFSFKIYDKNGSLLLSERRDVPVDLTKEEPDSILLKSYSSVSVYIASGKCTLVPAAFYSSDEKEEILARLYRVDDRDEIQSLELPSQKAVVVYAVDRETVSMFTRFHKNVKFYPVTYLLIDRISSLDENNRLLAAFTDGMVHIVAAERNRLLFANSFPADDLLTAEYFLLSVSKEVLFNPEHTTLYAVGLRNDAERKEIAKYFAGVVSLL